MGEDAAGSFPQLAQSNCAQRPVQSASDFTHLSIRRAIYMRRMMLTDLVLLAPCVPFGAVIPILTVNSAPIAPT
jgi:hypothetical protein